MKLMIKALHVCVWGAAALGLAMMGACDDGAAQLLADEDVLSPLPLIAPPQAGRAEAGKQGTAPVRARPARLWWRVSTGALGGPA